MQRPQVAREFHSEGQPQKRTNHERLEQLDTNALGSNLSLPTLSKQNITTNAGHQSDNRQQGLSQKQMKLGSILNKRPTGLGPHPQVLMDTHVGQNSDPSRHKNGMSMVEQASLVVKGHQDLSAYRPKNNMFYNPNNYSRENNPVAIKHGHHLSMNVNANQAKNQSMDNGPVSVLMLQNNLSLTGHQNMGRQNPPGIGNKNSPDLLNSGRFFDQNRRSLSTKTPLNRIDRDGHTPGIPPSPTMKTNAKLKGYIYPGVRTKAGHSGSTAKTNQDAYVIETDYLGHKDCLYSAVFDGHGTQGHKVSEFLKKQCHKNLQTYLRKNGSDPVMSRNRPTHGYNLDAYNSIRAAFIESFHFTNDDLNKQKNIYTDLSGSTGVTVMILNRIIYCGNVGDSKAVLVSQTDRDGWKCFELSKEHFPHLPEERRRIEQSGGRVEPFKMPNGAPIGPNRVWKKFEDAPGLMMSRTFGDRMGHACGIICTPGKNFFEG